MYKNLRLLRVVGHFTHYGEDICLPVIFSIER